MEIKNYDDALKYLEERCIFGIKAGLERINLLSKELGNPQNYFESIHVAGTNGKGSVCAMLSEILQTAGFKVGLFTSPHLESYCERIKVNGENISESEFAEILSLIQNFEIPATHFEVLTAAAFAYFAKSEVDFAVIETGLGGTWDSTNIITPKISVITNVALDHENILGDLKSIARNKAGIIKKNVPVVTAATGEPLKIIQEVAKKNNSPLYIVDKPVEVETNLQGEYQKINSAVAIQTAKFLKIPDEKIFSALKKVHWAGRFETVETNFGKIIIDGAHNPHGAAALRKSLDKKFPDGRRIFIFGALADKNIDGIIKNLFRAEDFVIVTEPISERAESVENICGKLKNFGVECIGAENIFDAVEKIKNFDGVKIVAGSLYLIGEVRKILNSAFRTC
ncbi:MAG: bifunctional folylpolyglutamate synthase/dihydrofolate synthase [Selenomonadaceae bacterium]|nr:bifunctional folylpolyglutamate synthase/dihydrofolate synthase [Selenomonadaceae bacterium]